MRYLPILEELFSSDSLILALIGLVLAIIAGIMMKTTKKNIIGLCACLTVYIIAEIISNIIRGSFLLDILMVFIGTIAIGGIIGFLIGFIVTKIKTKGL